MLKLQLQTFAPLSIVVATLLSLTLLNQSKPESRPLSQAPAPHNHEERGGKPSAQIDLLNSQDHSLSLNEEKHIKLQFTSPLTEGTLKIHITTDKGIELTSEQDTWVFDLSEQQSTLNLSASIYANSNGRHYLNIFSEYTDTNGNLLYRALASEFNVGSKEYKTAQKVLKANRSVSSSVIALPSKETIY